MILLGIDTSTRACSCALAEDDKLLFESVCNRQITHSQTILPMVRDMLKNAQVPISRVDAFAVSRGPGSFTGVRIGISAVKGLCLATDKKCIAVSSLAALAQSCQDSRGYIAAVTDARNGQVFASIFDNTGGQMRAMEEDFILPAAELCEKIKKLHFHTVFVGDGADLCYNICTDNGVSAERACWQNNLPRASGVLAAAFCAARCGRLEDGQNLAPLYIQIPQAERMLRAKQEQQRKG